LSQSSTSTIPDLNELLDLLAELETLEAVYTENPIVFFRPLKHGDQDPFFRSSLATVRLVLGSNRSGKTESGAAEAVAHALGFRPWLDEDDPDRIVRLPSGDPIPVPNIGRVVAQNFQTSVKQTIWPKLQKFLPRDMIAKVHKDQRGIPVQIDITNGSVIYLMSYDQDPMVFEGPNGHWFWCDEPPPYKIYIGLKRGLVDFGGHCWITCTPLTQPWMNDIIVERANVLDSGVRLFKFSIWDNCVENGGYLTREAIEEFLADQREDELEARLHGKFLHLAGVVYGTWQPEPPYWIDPFDIPKTWPRVCVIDPHPRKPIAVLWAAVNPDEQWFAYDVLWDRKLKTIAQVSERIKYMERLREDRDLIAHRIIDSSAKVPERTYGSNILVRFAEEGIRCALANKQNTQAGYDAIHEALRMRNEWSEPRLMVFNHCAPIKQNFMNFCYDEWQTDKQRDLKGDKQDYRKTNDDFIDCIRYIFQGGLTYQMLKGMARRQSEEEYFDDCGMPLDVGKWHTGYDRRRYGRRS